ncbi:MAG: helix-turn-helix domain-containing protein [Ruminococcaceae bacterium]|nr:helix-turn-helix domain-containing protein [Oscillospiraceae bacterium]
MYEEIKAFLPPDREGPLVLEMSGISYCDGTYRITRSRESRTCVMEYVVKGRGTITIEGRSYSASAGDVYVIPPETDHTYYSSADDPWIKIFFNVHGSLPRTLLKAYGLWGRVVFPAREMMPLFLQFYRMAQSGQLHDEVIAPCTLKLHEIVQRLGALTGEEAAVSGEAYCLKNRLDSRLDGNVTVEELAEAIHRSKDYVIKLFRREFGQTPHAYLLRRKMEMAQGLLHDTHLSVAQVAAAVGYDDPHYFSNAFKKHTGVSPARFRKAE